MNIFILHFQAVIAAMMYCDKHVPKMCVEAAQMMASGLRANRWVVLSSVMVLHLT